MSLYEKKLEKLEALAGLRECPHLNAVTYRAPDWATAEGQAPFTQTTCQDCRAVLHRSTEAGTGCDHEGG